MYRWAVEPRPCHFGTEEEYRQARDAWDDEMSAREDYLVDSRIENL